MTGDFDVYCAAIAMRKGITVEAYKAALNQEDPLNDPTFIEDKKNTTEAEFDKGMRYIHEEHSVPR